MIAEIETGDLSGSGTPLIDVRSPREYEKGHIPGAVSIPLFSDAERAHVGTLYTRESPEKALDQGYSYVRPKLGDFILRSREAAPDGNVTVYCWRGGMRSRSFAGHLLENGFKEVKVIRGGYKAYRNYVLAFFATPLPLKIIGGYTGSGKTPIISYLQNKGHQAVDLEALAVHRGSAFGNMGTQPTTEQFENNMCEEFRRLDIHSPIWLEDESHNIGGVNLPMNLYRQMLDSEVFFLEIPREERAKYLVTEYAGTDPGTLAEAIQKISRRLGSDHTREALRLLDEKNFGELAMLILAYYDKSYQNGLRLHRKENIFVIPGEDADPVKNGLNILNYDGYVKRNKADTV